MDNKMTESDILAVITAKVEDLRSKGVDAETIVGVIATYFRQHTLDRVLAKTKIKFLRIMVKMTTRSDAPSISLDILMGTITKVLSSDAGF